MIEKLNGQRLPEGWVWATVEQLANVQLGRQRSPKNHDGPHMRPYLRAANATWAGVNLTDVMEMNFSPEEFDKYCLQDGDILLSEASGSADEVGKPFIWRNELPNCCFQNTLIRVQSYGIHIPYLHMHFYNDARSGRFSKIAKGVGIHHLGAQRLAAMTVAVPPLNEQHRIVEAIETQFTRLDAAVTALKRSQANLKRYRAAVLKAACEGRLVPTEAELAQAEGRSYEPAAVLLERILVERRRKWEAENPKKKYQEPVAPDTSDLPELPEGWCWVKLDQVADISGGLTKNSKRDSLSYQLPYLRVANVYANRLALDDVQVIGITKNEVDRVLLKKNDLLVVEGNGSPEQIGRVAIWDGSIEPCLHQNHLIKARFTHTDVVGYVRYWLLSVGGRDVIMRVASSTSGLYTLSLSKVSDLVVPLPPLAEQQRIVAEVERRLSLIDQLEKTIKTDLARANRLRQSILKRAFAGQLVPQDPNDEPASVLLERIQAAKQGKPVQPPLIAVTE